jgi:ATP synthase protein I
VSTHKEEEPENDGRADREAPGGASGWQEDAWDRGSWDRDDWDEWGRRRGPAKAGAEHGSADRDADGDDQQQAGHLWPRKSVRYTRRGPESKTQRSGGSSGGRLDRGETIAFMLLAGIGLGSGIGYGLDRLLGSFPALMVIGVFVGFGIALYGVFLETR